MALNDIFNKIKKFILDNKYLVFVVFMLIIMLLLSVFFGGDTYYNNMCQNCTGVSYNT